jgi:hypothetical protein
MSSEKRSRSLSQEEEEGRRFKPIKSVLRRSRYTHPPGPKLPSEALPLDWDQSVRVLNSSKSHLKISDLIDINERQLRMFESLADTIPHQLDRTFPEHIARVNYQIVYENNIIKDLEAKLERRHQAHEKATEEVDLDADQLAADNIENIEWAIESLMEKISEKDSLVARLQADLSIYEAEIKNRSESLVVLRKAIDLIKVFLPQIKEVDVSSFGNIDTMSVRELYEAAQRAERAEPDHQEYESDATLFLRIFC